MADSNGQQEQSHDPRSNAGEIWRGLWIPVVGLVLAVGAKPFQDWIVPAGQQSPSRFIDELTYGIEHLGVVLIVGFIIRIAIESASQSQFLNLIDKEVKSQFETGVRKIAEDSLKSLSTVEASVKDVESSIRKVDEVLGFSIRRPKVIDPASKEELDKSVLNPSVIRDEYLLRLTLEPLARTCKSNPDLIKIRARTSYYVENLTDKPAGYPVRAWVDTLNQTPDLDKEDAAQFTYADWCPAEARGKSTFEPFIRVRELKDTGKIVDASGGLWLKYPLEEGIPAGKRYYVDVEATQINRKSDLFVWNMAALTKTLTVTVRFGRGFKASDFNVGARELHHIEDADFQNTREVDPVDGSVTWSIKQLLLPYQGVTVWWSPVDIKSANPAEANKANKNVGEQLPVNS
jgi:hypothetical protein